MTNCGIGNSNWQTSTRRGVGIGKAQPIGAGRQRKSQVRHQQGFADFRLSADKQDALHRQQARLHQARRRSGRLSFQKLGQREDRRRWLRHNSASLVASSKMASSTVEALRVAASRRAVRTSLLTLRKMPLVA